MAAGYTTSLLNNAQAILAERFQKPEFRHEAYNLIKAMLMDGQGMFQGSTLDMLKKSDTSVVDTYLLKKRSITAGSARSDSHTLSAFGDSMNVQLSFAITSGNYGTSLKMGGRNIFESSQMLANDLLSSQIATNNVIEAAIAAYLSTYKTQSNAASGSYSKFGEWDGTNFVWKIPATEKDHVFQYISEVMAINDYDVPLNVIADPVGSAIASQLAQQGTANATNLGWQFENQTIIKSRRITDATAGNQATFYVIPAGTVGMVDRIPTENREGRVLKNYDYTSMLDPLGTGLEYATHYYETGADNSSTGSETQDVTFEYENSVDYSLVKAPLSSASTDSTIFKFTLVD
ncbi:virion structural protein [Rhodobacteraceae phage LS06-2018-MD05]|nr:virion structural protein [Rhodobacteraceae phage LS06-2018-MD05]